MIVRAKMIIGDIKDAGGIEDIGDIYARDTIDMWNIGGDKDD